MAKGDAEMAALVAAVDGDVEFELALGELIGRLRRQHERDIEDMEIAKLIPHGSAAVIERFGTPLRTTFRRASRGRKLIRMRATPAMGDGTIP
jgi:hypothetical protein